MTVKKYSAIVIKAKPDFYVVECSRCNRSGIEPRRTNKECQSCGGVGKQKLKIPPGRDCNIGISKCSRCDKSGIEPRRSKKECQTCNGVGGLLECFPRVSCGRCDGSGIKPKRSKKECPTCSGAGSIWIENV